MPYKLNPALDLDALALAFEKYQRLQIIDFVTPDSANAMATVLETETEWGLSYNGKNGSFDVPAKALRTLSQNDHNALFLDVYAQAMVEFRYLFERVKIAEKPSKQPKSAKNLQKIALFMNEPATLSALRRITGQPHIAFADAQATRYGAGHFLKQHTDHAPEQNRLAAYVLNLSRDWQADWGGQLQYIGPDGTVLETCMPKLGVLNLFAVPQPHAVSFVPPYCPAKRHSMTGWLRTHS